MVENFGDYLRTLRLEKRYSLREVEDLSGVSNSYLGLIERGQRPVPGAEILKKLAPVYDVPSSVSSSKCTRRQPARSFYPEDRHWRA